MSECETLVALAEAVADGLGPDWDAAESAATAEGRAVIRNMRSAVTVALLRSSRFTLGPAERDAEIAPLEAGSFWGALRILEQVGRGRYGSVYRAWDSSLAREVALKLLHLRSDLASSEAGLTIEEGRLMARVRHPNVVTIYGAQTIEGRTGLWMEFIDGRTLDAELRERGVFEAAALTRVGVELSHALAAVHAAGLVHRDVKSSNVVREKTGRFVLGDFGTGREIEEAATEGPMAGTPVYLAPEVFQRQAATPRSDLYSLGVLLFHLATGRFPVSGPSLAALCDAHAAGRRSSLRLERPDLPALLTSAIDRALEPEPAGRFAAAGDMAQALAAWQTPSRFRWAPAGIAACVLAMAAAGAIVWHAISLAQSPASEHPRAAVLITEFEHGGDEPLLESTLKYALERELLASGPFRPVPPERLGDTLELMRKSRNSPIDVALAGDVARRDGHIKALLVGQVEKENAGGGYALAVRLLQPGDERPIATIRERAAAPADLLPAVRRLALRLRQALGESADSVFQSVSELARVTTPSLEALELYSRADRLLRDDGPSKAAEAERLLRAAVERDPGFASAYLRLFRALVEQHGVTPQARDAVRAAFDNSTGIAGREQLLIDGSYYAMLSSEPRTAAVDRERHLHASALAFEALLKEEPDNEAAATGLLTAYRGLDRHVEAHQTAVLVANTRPQSFIWNTQAAVTALATGEIRAAKGYARRAAAIMPPIRPSNAFWITWVRLFDAHLAWLANDGARAAAEIDQVAREMTSVPAESVHVVATHLSYLNLALGRLDKAEALGQLIQPREARLMHLLRIALQRENAAAVRQAVDRYGDIEEAARVSSLLIDAGVLSQARDAFAVLRRREDVESRYSSYIEGQLALADGRADEAIRLLEPTLRERRTAVGHDRWLRASDKLARALALKGDVDSALRILERASLHRNQLAEGLSWGYAWLVVQDQLAEHYREQGRLADAAAIDRSLRTLLASADADHRIKLRLLVRMQ